MAENRLLIIEDDANLREGLQFSFLGDGWEVVCVGTKKEGLRVRRNAINRRIWKML